MTRNNLKQKAIAGVAWTSIQRFAQIAVQFVSGVVLARLLTPEDYGCIGMLTIFMVLSASFIDGGFGVALIQKQAPTQEDYSTVFFWNLGISAVIYFVLFLVAPYIATFYKTPLLCKVLRVMGVVVIINALQTVQVNMLNKQLKFKKIAITSMITYVLSLSITIYLAYKGFGVWALVTQNLVAAIIPTIIYWITNNWFPKLIFSISSFKKLFSFGSFMLLSSIINTFCNNIQGLIIGRLYNPTTMGYYSKAQSTELLASQMISSTISQVTLPLYSELQNDIARLVNAIKRITLLLAYVSFPLLLILILLAKPIFLFIYSERWLPSVPYFQILCLAGLAICLQSVNGQAIVSIGKSKIMFKWTFIKRLLGLILIVIGAYLGGIWGLLFATVCNSWIIYIINASLVSKYIGYKLVNQIRDLLPVLLLAFISFTVSYILGRVLPYSMFISSLIELLVFLSIYVGASYLFKLSVFNSFMETAPTLLNMVLRKKRSK